MDKLHDGINEENSLEIHFIIPFCSFLLLFSNLMYTFYYFFCYYYDFYYIIEYTNLLIYSFYKSFLYGMLILILLGWGTLFFRWNRKFTKLCIFIFLYDLTFSILIHFSPFFINISNKLELIDIKNISEYLVILSIAIFSIFKRLLPLSKQISYEERNPSYFNKWHKIKYNKLIVLNLVIILYCLSFMITPFLDNYFYYYANNYILHFIFQLFFETVFNILFSIILYPKNYPQIYFDEVVYYYRIHIYLVANIYVHHNNVIYNDNKLNNIKKLNISNLTNKKLNKLSISKKRNYPIVIINPFVSYKNYSLFKEIHLGFVKKN